MKAQNCGYEQELVKAKADQVVSSVSSSTGVSEESVATILEHLGLSSALANRLRVDDVRLIAGSVPI